MEYVVNILVVCTQSMVLNAQCGRSVVLNAQHGRLGCLTPSAVNQTTNTRPEQPGRYVATLVCGNG